MGRLCKNVKYHHVHWFWFTSEMNHLITVSENENKNADCAELNSFIQSFSLVFFDINLFKKHSTKHEWKKLIPPFQVYMWNMSYLYGRCSWIEMKQVGVHEKEMEELDVHDKAAWCSLRIWNVFAKLRRNGNNEKERVIQFVHQM